MKKKEIEKIVDAEVRPAEASAEPESNEDQNQETVPETKKESKIKAFGKKALEKGKKALPAITGIAGIGVGALIMSKLGMKPADIADNVQELIPDDIQDSVTEITETAVEAAADQISE